MPTLTLHRPTPLSTAEIAALPGGAVPVRGEGDIVARARFRALDTQAAVQLSFALGQAASGARLEVEGIDTIDPSPTDAPDVPVSGEEDTLWAQPADETQEEPFIEDDLELDLPLGERTDEVPMPEAPSTVEPVEDVSTEPTDASDAPKPAPAIDDGPPAADTVEDASAGAAIQEGPSTDPDDPGPPPSMPVVDQAQPPSGTAALVPAAPVVDDGPVPADPWKSWDAGDTAGALRALRVNGLDSDGRTRVRALMQSTDPAEVALGCELACAADWRSSVQAMRRLLQHADTRVRQAAVTAIGELAGPALVPSVRMLLRDASPAVRGAAVAALMKLESR